MRWSAGDRGNIQDMRGRSAGMRAGSLGIGGLLIALVLSWATGVDFLSLLGGDGSSEIAGTSGQPVESTPQEERMVDFVDAVANDVQRTWDGLLRNRYQRTQVVGPRAERCADTELMYPLRRLIGDNAVNPEPCEEHARETQRRCDQRMESRSCRGIRHPLRHCHHVSERQLGVHLPHGRPDSVHHRRRIT